MTTLRIYSETDQTTAKRTLTEAEAIQQALAEIGVMFERWDASRQLAPDASQDEVLDAYKSSIDRLTAQFGFKSVDVITIAPDNPNKLAMRDKFLHEHTHDDFEVRFFVDGQGMFYIRKNEHVYAILCTRGDLLSVPANTKHWFDMGTEPSIKAIRLFTTPEGWVATFTGDKIAERFPTLDALGA
jgi:1,2-dihydroxy-3-keto-5-methylthiopentene dioxygenase